METKISLVVQYLSTSGTLADCIAFTQLVASQAWNEVARFYNDLRGILPPVASL